MCILESSFNSPESFRTPTLSRQKGRQNSRQKSRHFWNDFWDKHFYFENIQNLKFFKVFVSPVVPHVKFGLVDPPTPKIRSPPLENSFPEKMSSWKMCILESSLPVNFPENFRTTTLKVFLETIFDTNIFTLTTSKISNYSKSLCPP